MTDPVTRILLVDDDRELCSLLSEYLDGNGYDTAAEYTGEAALARVSSGEQFDLMVLDIMMPGLSGLELLPALRARSRLPVIMLTGRGEAIDRILGLEMGADDYIAKPCNPRELLARIKAVMRRAADAPDAVVRRPLNRHGIRLDPGQRLAQVEDSPLALTATEFDLLALLLERAGEAVSREELSRRGLHRELTAYDRAVDVHISRLRQLLRERLGERELIKTVRGIGYQLVS